MCEGDWMVCKGEGMVWESYGMVCDEFEITSVVSARRLAYVVFL